MKSIRGTGLFWDQLHVKQSAISGSANESLSMLQWVFPWYSDLWDVYVLVIYFSLWAIPVHSHKSKKSNIMLHFNCFFFLSFIYCSLMYYIPITMYPPSTSPTPLTSLFPIDPLFLPFPSEGSRPSRDISPTWYNKYNKAKHSYEGGRVKSVGEKRSQNRAKISETSFCPTVRSS